MPEKLRPENPGQKLQIQPENLSLLVPGGRLFTSLMLEKLRPKNPSKQLQITVDTAGKSRPITTDTAGKSRPVITDTARKSCGQ
jgi:hypothetical protein